MASVGSKKRALPRAALALGLSACASPLFAQTPTKQPPPAPPADTTTIVEKPDAVPPQATGTSPSEPVTPPPISPTAPEQKAPEHVPQDASGFHLSKLETK